MILKAIQWILKATNRHWLLPYVRSIEWIGKPTGMMGSSALLDQALWVLFSGANNMLAVHTNRNWVWPLWIEEQWQPRSSAFIPTGAGLLGANLSRRNWTSLGHSASPLECMVDPVGMITVEPHSWSLLPYLRVDSSLQAPPYLQPGVQQRLADDVLPVVETRYPAVGDVKWASTATASYIDDSMRITCRITIENQSNTPVPVVIGFGVRPYNVLSIGHINQLENLGSFLRVNQKWDVEILESPTRVLLGDRGTGDPMKDASPRPLSEDLKSIIARSGIAAGSIEYDRVLQPGEKIALGVVVWCDAEKKKRKVRPRLHTTVDSLIRAREEELRLEDLRSARIKLPEEKFENQLDAIKLRLPAFDDVTHFSPGTFLYHTHWYRDSYFISEAFSNLGFLKEVRSKIESYPQRQQASGAFVDHPGELDSHAIALCSMLSFSRKSGDTKLQRDLFESVWRGLQWIDKQRLTSSKRSVLHEGLLPASFSAEHFGGCDHYFWDNFWALKAMHLGRAAARRMGRAKEADALDRMSLSFSGSLRRAISATLERVGGQVLPVSPYRWPDAACIGNLVACDPLELSDICQPWLHSTLEFLLDSHFHQGLFFQSVFHTGLNPYLTAQVARVLIRLEDPRALTLLHAISDAASPTVTWPEAINPRTQGGCMGDGDHGWAAAEFCNLLRQMIVLEDSSGLVLFPGVQASWLEPGQVTSIHNAPTFHGRITASLESDNRGIWARWQLEPWNGEETTQLTLSLPRGLTDADVSSESHLSQRRARIRCSLRGERFFAHLKGAAV
ncbi:MAG: hypothetical protein FJY29_09845 [Betaproteobacteria bacterium]|nr:hypothetical protein [Betaproteobacteria bacterium]